MKIDTRKDAKEGLILRSARTVLMTKTPSNQTLRIHTSKLMQIRLENMQILAYIHVYQKPELNLAQPMIRPNVKYNRKGILMQKYPTRIESVRLQNISAFKGSDARIPRRGDED